MNVVDQLIDSALGGAPQGRLLSLRYATKAKPDDHPASAPAVVGTGATAAAAMGDDVLEVTYETPEGDEKVHALPEGGWNPNNPALRMMAAVGAKPSDFEDGMLDFRDKDVRIPLAVGNGRYWLNEAILEAGETALYEASWNPWENPDPDDSDEEETASDGADDELDDVSLDIEVK